MQMLVFILNRKLSVNMYGMRYTVYIFIRIVQWWFLHVNSINFEHFICRGFVLLSTFYASHSRRRAIYTNTKK